MPAGDDSPMNGSLPWSPEVREMLCTAGSLEEEDWTSNGSPPPGRRLTMTRVYKGMNGSRRYGRPPVHLEGVLWGGETHPQPVAHHASAVIGDSKLFTHGGSSTTGISSQLWMFDLFKWRQVQSSHIHRTRHTLTASHNTLYIHGGLLPDGSVSSDTFAFDLIGSSEWQHLRTTGAPLPVDTHTTLLYSNKLWVFGGATPQGLVQCLDISTNRWVLHHCDPCIDTPPVVQHHTAHCYHTVDNDAVMLVYTGIELYFYNFVSLRWNKQYTGGQVPPPCTKHVTVCLNDQLILHGGDSGGRITSDCYCLNIVTSTWRQVGLQGVPNGRRGHCGALLRHHGDMVCVLFGGEDGEGQVVSDTHTITVGKKRKRKVLRPKTAPTIKTNYLRTRPRKPDGPPPWSVTTSKATTARHFGVAPEIPWHYRYTPAVGPSGVDSIVARLSSTKHMQSVHQHLADKYLFNPEENKRQLTKGEMEDFTDRMYHQQIELQEEYRRNLECKYVPTKESKKLVRTDVVDMVHRLTTVPEKKEYCEYLKPSKPVDVQQSVERLFYNGVANSKAIRKQLFNRYAHQTETTRLDSATVGNLVNRLYTVTRQ